MNNWPLTFITEENFTQHVANTIKHYGANLHSYDLAKFNSNIIDPIKVIFDKAVYRYSWDELVKNEIFRQRDKAGNNDIGYFHQRFFCYVPHCVVPQEGWDVIFTPPQPIHLPDCGGEDIHTIYVEMKNKHNTMNSASSAKTYIKAQDQLLADDTCAVFLVEAIAKRSQNIKWTASVDGRKVQHKKIRRVSMDQFYAITTGVEDAFYQMCLVLPDVIEKVLANAEVEVPHDTVIDELRQIADSKHISMAMAFYLLGFGTYNGFPG